MVNLNFEKKGNHYVAEIEVASDFNLHIERELKGYMYLQIRTTPTGDFDSVNGFNVSNADLIIDYDFSALVYPRLFAS